MPQITFGRRQFEVDLVALDKDGTLLDFELMWGRLARAWADRLTSGVPGAEVLRTDLFRSWGYRPDVERTLPRSPLAIASTEQLATIAAVTLYRHGLAWPQAEDRTRGAFQEVREDPSLTPPELVRPRGDVAGLLGRLRASGARVAVVTTDSRAESEETLRLLGVEEKVDALVCGDDGLPLKPAPDMLLAACGRLGIEPARTAMVGDTEADLLMARRAGAGLVVAVLGGAGDAGFLSQLADVVMDGIDNIVVPVDPELLPAQQ